MSKKLETVLEYLIAGKEAEAKDLLHQVFIEKARKIHEDIMSREEEMDETLGGDEGDDWKHDITHHDKNIEELAHEIEAEETMAEDEDMMDMADAEDEMADDEAEIADDEAEMADDEAEIADDEAGEEIGDEDLEGIEDTIGDLESALAELKAEFEKLEAGSGDEEGEEEEAEGEEIEQGEEEEAEGEEENAEEDAEEDDEEDDEEEMDESWLEEDFDDLAEAIELEKVSVPTGGEVGSGKFSPADADAASKSPTPASQTQRFGAKPVVTGEGPKAAGFSKQSAPGSKDQNATTKPKLAKVSKEGNAPEAKINKTASEFGADTVGKDSPLSKAPRK